MLLIVEPTTTAGAGITRPRLCRLSDDEFYYVKGRNLTAKGLVNEIICAHLGHGLRLPIPDFELAELPSVPSFGEFAEIKNDLGFGTLFASKRVPNLMELDLSQVSKVPEVTRRDVAAFDFWIGNGDRTLTEHGGNPNLFWDLEGDRLVVLDHNLAFDSDLSRDELLSTHAFRKDLEAVFASRGLRQHYSDVFNQILVAWPDIIAHIPEGWLYSDEWMTIEAELDFEGMRAYLGRLCDVDGWNV